MGDLIGRISEAIYSDLCCIGAATWEDANRIAKIAATVMQGDPAPVPGMTKTESLVYRFLEANPGINSRTAIYDAVYANRDGRRIEVDPKIIHIMICKIRHKLPPNQVIETVHGFGYGLKYLEAQDASFGFTANSRTNHVDAASGNEPA